MAPTRPYLQLHIFEAPFLFYKFFLISDLTIY